MTSLFAKSARTESTAKTLPEHTDDVLRAVYALFGQERSPTRLAKSWLRFFGLSEEDFSRILRHLRVGAAAHDWGKANDGFQDAVNHGGEQVIRHEHLSGLLLAELIADQKILNWFRVAGVNEGILLAAVISHHLKVGTKGKHPRGVCRKARYATAVLRARRLSEDLAIDPNRGRLALSRAAKASSPMEKGGHSEQE